jgi:hypothetical protein
MVPAVKTETEAKAAEDVNGDAFCNEHASPSAEARRKERNEG